MRRLGAPLLALAAVLATLAVAELAARWLLLPPRYHNEPLWLDAELGFRGIPGHRSRPLDEEGVPFPFALNQDGFRGPPLPPAGGSGDAEGGRRIVFVGDSFLVAAGLPEADRMSERVEAELAGPDDPVRVFNLSAADYGTGQELLLLRRHGARLAPDVVVLAVYPANDLVNNFEGLAFRTGVSPGDYIRPYLVPDDAGLSRRDTHPRRAWLRRHLRLFAALERRAVAFGARRGWRWLHPVAREAPPEERLAAGLAPREHQEIFRVHPPDAAWEQGWQRTERLLEAFHDACRALSAELFVVVIPDLHQVRRTAVDVEEDLIVRAIHGVPLDRYLDWNLPERRLAAFLDEREIPRLLLLPRLRRAVAAGETVYLRDRHLNARGHEIAAEAIVAALAGQATPTPAESLGGPVRLPAPRNAPAMISLGDPDHWPYRGDLWLPWVPSPEEGAVGALSLERALVVVPVRGRELTVRGIAAARHYPLDARIDLVTGPGHEFRIEKPGPFVLRAMLPVARLPKSDGWIALRISSEADGGSGVIVREIGFEDAGGVAQPRSR